MLNEEWSSESYSTHDGIEYSVHRRQQSESRQSTEECTLVVVSIRCEGGDQDTDIYIPCLNCDQNHIDDKEHYFENHAWLIQNLICENFPNMPRSSAEDISRSVKSVIELANDLHRSCPYKEPVTVIHNVYIDIHLPMESFRPASRPAPLHSIPELFSIKRNVEEREGDRFEIGWSDEDHECVICMDEIETRKSSLSMPCSHVFHMYCLVQWLYTSNVCPLCRHQLPTD